MKMLLDFDTAVLNLNSSSRPKLRKLVVEAKVLAMKSSCSRNMEVESSGVLIGSVSSDDAITVLAALRWTCQMGESIPVLRDIVKRLKDNKN
jgi:hypothetical protein